MSEGTSGSVGVGRDNNGNINTGQQFSAGDNAQIVYAEAGATVVIGDAPVPMSAVDRQSALGRYLQHIISQNRYLQLQGIRSGGRLVNIELDRIYITLRATRNYGRRASDDELMAEQALAPGERAKLLERQGSQTEITVNQALADHSRLVVLGDPGSGKTTLLRYLALLYARDLAESGSRLVARKLGLGSPDTTNPIPILLPLRQLGRYLAEHHAKDDGTEGHGLLLAFLFKLLANERIPLPQDFFDQRLLAGQAVVLLDGLDEVPDPDLRRRVARLVEAFTRAYPACRYVVTSRIVGYSEASQLAEAYAVTTVRDFSPEDVQHFLTLWYRLVSIGQMGPGDSAEAHAAAQTQQLLSAMAANERVQELAINPLMLTVIALIHRDQVELPKRRAELYAEAVDVLLGKWDDARGVQDGWQLAGKPFDLGDRRLVMQALALHMHEQNLKDIEREPLRRFLEKELRASVPDAQALRSAVERFLTLVEERTGLLMARAEDCYAFSHLTFQEYLAALAVAGRDDYVEYALAHSEQAWWREVILLQAGHLSTQNKDKTSRLILAIADLKSEPEPYHNLVLAAECLRDAGIHRVAAGLEQTLQDRLRRELDAPVARGRLSGVINLLRRGMSTKTGTTRRIAAANALGRIGGQHFWHLPWGEPDWDTIPAGEFIMGEDQKAHKVLLPTYAISRIPITCAQYQLFLQQTMHPAPKEWLGQNPPKGKETHPVVNVSWSDAMAYCRWLSGVTGTEITLPSEAEWEKAARGRDGRAYPWGNHFDAALCNTRESGFAATIPAGIFAGGASPYGCLDMAGNVWEWTRSLWGNEFWEPTYRYPYIPDDGREALQASDEVFRVVRGGSWLNPQNDARCAFRYRDHPSFRYVLGFRVALCFSPV